MVVAEPLMLNDMYIGNKEEFKRRSDYQKRIAAMQIPPEKKEKKVCVNHPIAIWGKKKDGTWYEQCYRGFNTGEACRELVIE